MTIILMAIFSNSGIKKKQKICRNVEYKNELKSEYNLSEYSYI